MWRTSSSPGIPALVSLTPVPISLRLSSCHVWKYLKAHRQRHKNSDFYSGPVRSVKRLESHFMFWVETVKSETWHDVSQSAPLGSYIPSYLCIHGPGLQRVSSFVELKTRFVLFLSCHDIVTGVTVSRHRQDVICHDTVCIKIKTWLTAMSCHDKNGMTLQHVLWSGNNWQEKHLSQKASIKHSLSQWSDTTVLDYVAVSNYLMTINTHVHKIIKSQTHTQSTAKLKVKH